MDQLMHSFSFVATRSRIPTRFTYGVMAALLGVAVVATLVTPGGGGWQALGFLFAPDLALLVGIAPGLARGQIHPRAVVLYNAVHHVAGPLVLTLAAVVWLGLPWLAGALVWALHIAVDRVAGFGPRTAQGFRRE